MKRTRLAHVVKLALALALLPAVASAHPGHDGGHGLAWDFASGFAHPLGGLDHLVAMLAVGLWAALAGGRARWAAPALFVGMLVVGAALGRNDWIPGWFEQLIAASLLILGLMVCITKRLPAGVGLALIALFGAFHGFSHGVETPASAGFGYYSLGFALASAQLHLVGLGLGYLANRTSLWLTRLTGTAVAVVGAVLLVCD